MCFSPQLTCSCHDLVSFYSIFHASRTNLTKTLIFHSTNGIFCNNQSTFSRTLCGFPSSKYCFFFPCAYCHKIIKIVTNSLQFSPLIIPLSIPIFKNEKNYYKFSIIILRIYSMNFILFCWLIVSSILHLCVVVFHFLSHFFLWLDCFFLVSEWCVYYIIIIGRIIIIVYYCCMVFAYNNNRVIKKLIYPWTLYSFTHIYSPY